jgi:hypothetical protein
MAKAEQAKILAAQSLTLSDEHGFQRIAAQPRIVLGEPRATLGHAAECVAQVRQD